ncbi:MAG TPA: S8 family peptidase [Thermoflexales bacterium]|nr:S8 family peptidase [Thermoflexales bacterium]
MPIARAHSGLVSNRPPKARRFTLALIACIASLAWPAQASGAPEQASASPRTDRFIVRYLGDGGIGGGAVTVATARERTAAIGVAFARNVSYVREMSGGAHVIMLPERIPIEQAEEFALRARANAVALGIESIEPDRILRAYFTPTDPQFGNQWHLQTASAGNASASLPGAWDVTTGDPDLVVAIIDTGVRKDHPDLAGRFLDGYDFVTDPSAGNDGNGRDPDPSDPGDWVTSAENATPGSPYFGCGAADSSWHGTHVAGIVGASGNNGLGVAGVNWKSKLLPVRVLGKCGGYTSDVVDAVRWAGGLSVPSVPLNRTPARVLNMSLGGPGTCGGPLESAVRDVTAAGSIVVVAAGNSNQNASGETPANCPGVIAVGATDHTGNRAFYSNYGSRVTISAPGGNTRDFGQAKGILSTLNAGKTTPGGSSYAYYQGTSMATPLVAGIVSLMLSANPGLNAERVADVLRQTATPFGSGTPCGANLCGAGIVNAAATVASASSRAAAPAVGNGDFESGHAAWRESSNNGYALISQIPDGLGVAPRSGTQAVWLGYIHREIDTLEQTVRVTSQAPYLIYWQWIQSEETNCKWDSVTIRANGNSVLAYGLCAATRTDGWRQQIVDLKAYANQSVTLRIEVATDASLRSSLFIDDVTLGPAPYN